MHKPRFTEEQIIHILKGVEAGQRVPDACRTSSISEQAYHRWKAKSPHELKDACLTRRFTPLAEVIWYKTKESGSRKLARPVCIWK